jgi:DNA modification methylase
LPDGSALWDYVNEPVDLIFADPPYNYKVTYDGDITQDNIAPEEYRYWVGNIIRKLAGMTKDGGTLWWLCPSEDGKWVWPELERYGTLLHGRPIIWYERFSQYQKTKLTNDYRLLFPIVVGAAADRCCGGLRLTFNPDAIREQSVRQQMGDKRADPRGRVPGHVWTVRRLQGNAKDRVGWHPAQLAPEPLERIVKGWTDPGDVVLDAFAGSGSMGVVCKKLERLFVGVEQSAHYCRQIKHRMDEMR